MEHRFSDLKTFSVDPHHQREILSIPQPYWNHNSGIPVFGPDGHLYLSTGDGGNANDPHDHRKTLSLLGKVLRIDVDSQVWCLPYGIPSDNPFVGNPDTGKKFGLMDCVIHGDCIGILIIEDCFAQMSDSIYGKRLISLRRGELRMEYPGGELPIPWES